MGVPVEISTVARRASAPVLPVVTTVPPTLTSPTGRAPTMPTEALAIAQWRVAVAAQRADEAEAAWRAEEARMRSAKRSLDLARQELESIEAGSHKVRKVTNLIKEE